MSFRRPVRAIGRWRVVGRGGGTWKVLDRECAVGEVKRLFKSNAKHMSIQSQASDVDIMKDDVPKYAPEPYVTLKGDPVSSKLEELLGPRKP